MRSNQTREIDQVVSAMVFIYNQLKATGIRDHTGKNLEFLYFNIGTLNEEQQKARQFMDQVGDKHDVGSEIEQGVKELLDYHPQG